MSTKGYTRGKTKPRFRFREIGVFSNYIKQPQVRLELVGKNSADTKDIGLCGVRQGNRLRRIGEHQAVITFHPERSAVGDVIATRQGDFVDLLFLSCERLNSTIEVDPNYGKYHFDGHRDCKFVCAPQDTKKYKGICPKCKKPLVIGVMNRVEELADRTESQAKQNSNAIPYKSLVPLPEIIGDAIGVGVHSKAVQKYYEQLIKDVGSEFFILLHASLNDIEKSSTKQIAIALDRVRKGEIYVYPGYDGEFGIVKVFGEKEDRGGVKQLGFSLEE